MTLNLYDKFRRITSGQVYLPEIDGIRFLAIALVIIYHTYMYFVSHAKVPFWDDHADYKVFDTFLINSDRGVEMFFVLSGFILCLPFAHHYINNGKEIALKHYYLRRVTRLEPPYFIAITGIFLLQILSKPISVMLPSWLASLAYSHNIIFGTESLITVVTWSLEIEIQFYLLAPLLFSLLLLPRTARRLILVLSSISIVCIADQYPLPVRWLYGYIQYFLVGILLADLYVSDTLAGLLNKKWMAFFSVICLIIVLYLPVKPESSSPGSLLPGKILLPFAISLFFYIILKNPFAKNIFRYKFIPIAGGMCYSIYLLHYTIIGFTGRFTSDLRVTSYFLPNFILQVILFSIPILIVSGIFYLCIERPFMSSRWTDKLMRKNKRSEEINSVAAE